MALVLGAGLGAWGTHWWQQRSPGQAPAASAPAASAAPASRKVKVEVAPVKRVRLERSVAAVGTLRSHDSVMLRPEISGRIAEINFTEGGKVAKGQVLVRLDDSVARARLSRPGPISNWRAASTTAPSN